MRPEELYHTGIVVDDLRAARRWYTEQFGYTWTPVMPAPQWVWTPAGRRFVVLWLCYSGPGSPHRLELIRTVPGTVWVPSDSGLHHHGRWSADVDAELAVLERQGIEVEVKASLPNGTTLWAYCRGPVGPRVELVGPWMKPLAKIALATARLPRTT